MFAGRELAAARERANVASDCERGRALDSRDAVASASGCVTLTARMQSTNTLSRAMSPKSSHASVARLLFLGVLSCAPLACASPPIGEPTHYTVAGGFTLLPFDPAYHSQWIITPMCGVLPRDGKPALALRLDNTTDKPIWIRVHVDGADGDMAWDETVALEPQGGTLLKHVREHVRADTDYPASIAIFGDAQCSKKLEDRAGRFRVTEGELARCAPPKA
jgi:hypothetical protein